MGGNQLLSICIANSHVKMTLEYLTYLYYIIIDHSDYAFCYQCVVHYTVGLQSNINFHQCFIQSEEVENMTSK